MKRQMLSKYAIAIENEEGEVDEHLVLGKRTLVPFGLSLYGLIIFVASLLGSGVVTGVAVQVTHLNKEDPKQFFYMVPSFLTIALISTVWVITHNNFRDFTSMETEIFYYKKVDNPNLESQGNQLMLGMLAENREFDHGVIQLSKEHNKFIKDNLLPNSPLNREAELQEIREDDKNRTAGFNDYMDNLMRKNGLHGSTN